MPTDVLSGVVSQVARTYDGNRAHKTEPKPSEPTPVVSPQSNSSEPVEGNRVAAEGQTLPLESAAVDLTEREVADVVKNLNEYVQNVRRELSFKVDDESGRTVIKVIDSETNKVIREIPPEEVRAISRHLDQLSGVFIHAQV